MGFLTLMTCISVNFKRKKVQTILQYFQGVRLKQGHIWLLYKIFMVLEDTKFLILVVKNSYQPYFLVFKPIPSYLKIKPMFKQVEKNECKIQNILNKFKNVQELISACLNRKTIHEVGICLVFTIDNGLSIYYRTQFCHQNACLWAGIHIHSEVK